MKLITSILSWLLVGILTGIGVKMGQVVAEKATRKFEKGKPASEKTVDGRFEQAKPCQEGHA